MGARDMLQEQFQLYDKFSEQVESWKVAHEKAMLCRDVEEAIAIGLTILENIRRRSAQWARQLEEKRVQFSWDDSREMAESYRRWLECSARLLQAMEALESENYSIDDGDRFRRQYQDVSLMSLDVEHDRASLASLEAGLGIPAKQAMNDLRRGVRPGSA